jgi:hypothetical protein
MGGKVDVGSEVDVGESLQQFWGSAFDDSRLAVDDEVLLETGRLDLGALYREGDAWVAGDVSELRLIDVEVSRDESSWSSPTQMQVTCGEPSGLSVTRWAREPDSISARALCGSFIRTKGVVVVRAGQAIGPWTLRGR